MSEASGVRPRSPRISVIPVRAARAFKSLHVEVLSMLRRYAIRGEPTGRRAGEALAALADLRALAYPAIELADAVWDLRAELTAYDAAYLALARRLDVGLITLDGRLAKAAAQEGRLLPVQV